MAATRVHHKLRNRRTKDNFLKLSHTVIRDDFLPDGSNAKLWKGQAFWLFYLCTLEVPEPDMKKEVMVLCARGAGIAFASSAILGRSNAFVSSRSCRLFEMISRHET